MTTLTADTLYIPPETSSLRARWGAAAKQKASKLWDLRGTFAKVATGAGLNMAFKSAAVGATSSAGAGIFAAAAAGGAAVTTYSAVRDYRSYLKEREEKSGFWGVIKGFFSFLFENKKKYAWEMAKNSTFGALGAGLVEFGDEIAQAFIPGAQAAPLMDVGTDDIGLVGTDELTDEAMVLPVEPDIAEPSTEISASEMSAFDTYLAELNTGGWSDQAMDDLEKAKLGEPWAIQNLAFYSLNTDDVPFDLEMARTLAEAAAEMGEVNAPAFLEDMERIWGIDAFDAPEVIALEAPIVDDVVAAEAVEIADEAALQVESEMSAFDTYLAGLNTDGWSDQALDDLEDAKAGEPWAIQNLAFYSMNTKDVPFDLEMARTLAEAAAEMGEVNAPVFLAYMDTVYGSVAPETPPVCEVFNETSAAGPAFSIYCEDDIAETMLKSGEHLVMNMPNGEAQSFYNNEKFDVSLQRHIETHVSYNLRYNPELSSMIFDQGRSVPELAIQ